MSDRSVHHPMSTKSICIVAGDPSGDVHGAWLIREITSRHPEWSIWGLGGDRMAAAGMELWQHARDWAVMGFAEVIKTLPLFHRRLSDLDNEIQSRKPDGVILIDYPGFNLKLAPRVKKRGIPVMYYIVPQLWAWGKRRITVFRKHVDHTIVVFPFEKDFFESHGVPAEWVGHPFVDEVKATTPREQFRRQLGMPDGHTLVALMPGVRSHDYDSHLPVFTEALKRIAESVPNVHGAIGVSRAVAEATKRVSEGPVPLSVTPETYNLLTAADVVITKTGTTTVECAILGTPMVTAYRTSRLTYLIARTLVDVPHIAMPNLVAKRKVVPEHVQDGATPSAIARDAITLLTNPDANAALRRGLAEVREALGAPGAVARAARAVEQWIQSA
ncbi:MAG: lipid-A-disaccharide synthase [candidate division Zixibacteria bacterium]|nr:lipid-A-disaccharide synthase [candidate division Zixibacteria bacterium]